MLLDCDIDLMGEWPAGAKIVYEIVDLPKEPIGQGELEAIFEEAFETWNSSANLPFSFGKPVGSEKVNLVICWVDKLKSEKGFLIGYADYPPPSQDQPLRLLLNRGLDWSTGGPVRVQTFALHELGHTIGLGHGTESSDLMCDCIDTSSEQETLSLCDEQAIRDLYHPDLLVKVRSFFRGIRGWLSNIVDERTDHHHQISYRKKEGFIEEFLGYGAIELAGEWPVVEDDLEKNYSADKDEVAE